MSVKWDSFPVEETRVEVQETLEIIENKLTRETIDKMWDFMDALKVQFKSPPDWETMTEEERGVWNSRELEQAQIVFSEMRFLLIYAKLGYLMLKV